MNFTRSPNYSLQMHAGPDMFRTHTFRFVSLRAPPGSPPHGSDGYFS